MGADEAIHGSPGRLYGHRAWPLPDFGALEDKAANIIPDALVLWYE